MKNRLKELRQLQHWSQSDLARELGITRQAVNGFESGKFAPSLDMALKIASLFAVPMEEIFIYEGKNPTQTLVERVKDFLGFEFGFERFTDNAIAAINFARNEAARSHSLQVEPEHLWLGLLANSSSTSARLLRASGANLPVETDEDYFEPHHCLKLSPQIKFVLELALQIVRLQGKKSMGTEHLLWGLLRLAETDKAISEELFQSRGIDLEKLSEGVRETV